GQWWRPDGPGGGAVGFTDRVDAPGGLEVVVPPVQSVEVVEAGGASPGGVRVVELLDVVVLRVIAGALGASGDGAAGSGEPQVLDQLGSGPVALGGELEEPTGERVGEDPVPHGLGLGEFAGHRRRQRGHAVVGGGGVV